MVEKERYQLFGEHCIKDNNPDARCQLLNAYVACVILNEQDKENQQLKHQLHDLPKKIVGEIRKQICGDCFWEECEEQHCEFYFIIEYLNAILKKYGGKNDKFRIHKTL